MARPVTPVKQRHPRDINPKPIQQLVIREDAQGRGVERVRADDVELRGDVNQRADYPTDSRFLVAGAGVAPESGLLFFPPD